MSTRESFKSDLLSKDITILPGVYDGLSARVVQNAGFTGAFITGSGLSESRLGMPDVGLMGLELNAQACREIVECCPGVGFLADGDTGYGNAVNIHYCVRQFENAGLAGVMFEDQVWPKRCGHMAGKEVISKDEMVGKLRAAADARQDPFFMIKARTDAAGVIGLQEAIDRLNAYAEAGADLLFADALLSEDDIATVAKNVSKPLVVNMGMGLRKRSTTPLISPSRLQELGVSAVIYPRLLTCAAVRGMMNALEMLQQQLDQGTVEEHAEICVSFEELNDILDLGKIRELEQRYLPRDVVRRKYSSKNPAGGRAV